MRSRVGPLGQLLPLPGVRMGGMLRMINTLSGSKQAAASSLDGGRSQGVREVIGNGTPPLTGGNELCIENGSRFLGGRLLLFVFAEKMNYEQL